MDEGIRRPYRIDVDRNAISGLGAELKEIEIIRRVERSVAVDFGA